jgi:glycyl-radical enzyme activating protein
MQKKKDKGLVFDIQRASLYDGPGIRTTVFLKGCPLNCLWCHNPEGISGSAQLYYNGEKCVRCFNCVDACPKGIHHFSEGVHYFDSEECTLCGECVKGCNYAALKVVGVEMSVNEVLKEVLADVDFYQNSGGGITLSGGEPLFQFEFSRELLKQSKFAGINTCVETSGLVSSSRFEQILPLIDLLLFDYKITGTEQHKKYTGVDNDLILSNLDLAYRTGVPVILRCPIIPGVNDTPEHFRGIRGIDEKYPLLKGIELMPYHKMGTAKGETSGCYNQVQEWEPADQAMKDQWISKLNEMGCKKVKIS